MLTVEDVNKRVQEVADNTGDPEVAHSMEDALLWEVLEEISEGKHPLNAAEIAQAALKTRKMGFPRWCA